MADGEQEAHLALAVILHTETGKAEFARVELWRRSPGGALIREVKTYAVGVCHFDLVDELSEADFSSALASTLAAAARCPEGQP